MAKSVNLYSVNEGKIVPFSVEVDQNSELVLSREGESIKFPAGLTKTEFNKLVTQHNKANDGVVARTADEIAEEEKARERSEKLVDSL